MPDPERAAFLLRDQASYCTAMGSPLYAQLLERAAHDAAARGPVFELLEPFEANNLRADALALRLMAAAHRLVLTGAAPRLAAHYPTAGGNAGPDGAWDAFLELVATQAETLAMQQGESAVGDQIRSRLALYREHQPYLEPVSSDGA